MTRFDMMLTNALLATPKGNRARAGSVQGAVSILEDAVIGINGDTIAYAGPPLEGAASDRTVSCAGRLVTPGLVDAHTHLVFGGWRQHELRQKIAGASYLEILQSGGGILSTVKSTRAISLDELARKTAAHLGGMFRHGTTTAECKSGYGLDDETEAKQLEAAAMNDGRPVDVVRTFMGAHAVPPEYSNDRQGYLRLLTETILPGIAKENLAEFCDVFCETGVFSVQESLVILRKARELGLGLKAHVDEIDPVGGAEMAAEAGCVSAEHLIAASDEGIAALAGAGVIAVLLPLTSLYLGKPFARARAMIDAGVPVAVATDFNPGSCPCPNLQLAMNFACTGLRMTPEEALTAVTLNAAAAVGRADSIGSVEKGKKADLVIWTAADLESLFYKFGMNQADSVIKSGTLYIVREETVKQKWS